MPYASRRPCLLSCLFTLSWLAVFFAVSTDPLGHLGVCTAALACVRCVTDAAAAAAVLLYPDFSLRYCCCTKYVMNDEAFFFTRGVFVSPMVFERVLPTHKVSTIQQSGCMYSGLRIITWPWPSGSYMIT